MNFAEHVEQHAITVQEPMVVPDPQGLASMNVAEHVEQHVEHVVLSVRSDIADPEPQSLECSDDEEAESQSSDLGLVDRSDDAEAEPQCLDLVKRVFNPKIA